MGGGGAGSGGYLLDIGPHAATDVKEEDQVERLFFGGHAEELLLTAFVEDAEIFEGQAIDDTPVF